MTFLWDLAISQDWGQSICKHFQVYLICYTCESKSIVIPLYFYNWQVLSGITRTLEENGRKYLEKCDTIWEKPPLVAEGNFSEINKIIIQLLCFSLFFLLTLTKLNFGWRYRRDKIELVSERRLKYFKGVLHLWALFLKVLCIFSKNKATSDKVSYGSGQKCSKELKNHNFTSV